MQTIVNGKLNDVVANPAAHATSSNEETLEKQENKDFLRTKRSYIPVEIEKRQQLIKAVEEEGLTIKEAA
jgi:hypothetical protein